MFDSGWAAAVAAIITALIVGGTAIAAFRQLRHGPRRYIDSGEMARDYDGLERDPRPFSLTTGQ